MSRIIKSGLIQLSLPMTEGEGSIDEIVKAMTEKHLPYIENNIFAGTDHDINRKVVPKCMYRLLIVKSF